MSYGPDPLPEYGQCVHKVAVDAGGPDRLYAQNHFGVFRSDDAGVSWSSIAEGLPVDFGFPIVASPHTPGTAWVVPLVADMQRVPPDGGCGCTAPGTPGRPGPSSARALPDDAWTAVMRDAFCADDRDPTGLYFGTRDGCVYASADEGETFTLVADHLPDVLTVRAAVMGAGRERPGAAARRARGAGRRREAPGPSSRRATRWPICSTRSLPEHPMLAGGSATRPVRCAAS